MIIPANCTHTSNTNSTFPWEGTEMDIGLCQGACFISMISSLQSGGVRNNTTCK